MNRASVQFDVFLSYNSRDGAVVERIARALEARGLRVFLDRWYLKPGLPWPQALERTLARCAAVAVFVGAEDMGPWQLREQYMALERQARDETFPVIPVLLPKSDSPFGFLSLNMWIDLRADVEDADALDVLAAVVRGDSIDPEGQLRSENARQTIPPYRGLQAFREEDADFFCGREAFTERLLKAVRDRPLVSVVGASGSGKSSVVRAGLVPALRVAGDTVWEVATMVPGEHPLRNLAATLAPILEPEMSQVDRLVEVRKLAEHLESGTLDLPDVTASALDAQPGTGRLLLFVDQWEELYTLTENAGEVRAFQQSILDARKNRRVSVVLTMRGDFFGQALAYRDLSDALQDAVVNLGPMTRDELKRSMTVPAHKVGLDFEDHLIERVLSDVGNEPGNLPLLEFTLHRLWEQRQGRRLLNAAYLHMGGVQGAIADRAESILGDLDDHRRELVRRVMIQLVQPGEGRDDTRKRAQVPDTNREARDVVRKLADARLLVTARDDASGEEIVEIAHEALIHNWGRLRNWVGQDREFLRTRARIEAMAAQWIDDGEPEDRLLPPGRALAEGEDVLERRADELGHVLVRYIQASLSAQRKRVQAREGENRRRLRRSRTVTAIMTVLALLALVVGYMAYDRSVLAERARAVAEERRSRLLAGLSQQQTDSGNATLGILLALEALPKRLDDPGGLVLPSAVSALDRAVHAHREIAVFGGRDQWMASAAFDAEGGRLVTTPYDNTARLWDAKTGKALAVLRGHENDVWMAAFDATGRRLITAGRDHTARIWDAATGTGLVVLRHERTRHRYDDRGITWAGFAPDGARALTLGSGTEGTVIAGIAMLWNTETGALVAKLGEAASTATFDPSGRRVVTTAHRSKATLWDATTGAQLRTLGDASDARFDGSGARVLTVPTEKTEPARVWDTASGEVRLELKHREPVRLGSFDPSGARILTVAGDEARLWNARTGGLEAVLGGDAGWIEDAAFDPAGKRIVTVSTDGTARLWDVASRQPIAVLGGHEGPIVNPATQIWKKVQSAQVAYSPDGRWLATASEDGTARIWRAESGKLAAVLRGHSDVVDHVAFDRSGTRVLTASADRTIRLWATDVGAPAVVLRGAGGIELSHDGRRVATGSADGTVRVWDVDSGEALHVFDGSGADFSPDDARLVTTYSRNRAALIWDARTGAQLQVLRHPSFVWNAEFSPDGNWVVTFGGFRDGAARVWDTATGKQLHLLRHGDQVRVDHATFSSDGKRILTAASRTVVGAHNQVRIWDARSGEQRAVLEWDPGGFEPSFDSSGSRVITRNAEEGSRDAKAIYVWDVDTAAVVARLRGHDHWIWHAEFDAAGRRVLTASKDKTARIFDAATGEQLVVLRGHHGEITRARFSRDGIRVATGSYDNTARLWRSDTGELVAILRGHDDRVEDVAFSPDGRLVLTASRDHTVGVWRIAPTGQRLLEHARCLTPRKLTAEERARFGLGEDTGKGSCAE